MPVGARLAVFLGALFSVLAEERLPCEAAEPPALRVLPAPDGTFELRDGDRVLARLPSLPTRGAFGPPSIEEVAAEGRKLLVVRRAIQEKTGKPASGAGLAWVGLLERAGAAPIWSGVLGPLDADGDVVRHLEVGAPGVSLYETAGRVSRCDGVPVRLAWQKYDFARRRFEAVAPPAAAPGAASITARRLTGPAHGRPKIAFPFTVASAPPAEVSGESDARALVAPLALSDGDPESAWHERLGTGGGGSSPPGRAEVASPSPGSRSCPAIQARRNTGGKAAAPRPSP